MHAYVSRKLAYQELGTEIMYARKWQVVVLVVVVIVVIKGLGGRVMHLFSKLCGHGTQGREFLAHVPAKIIHAMWMSQCYVSMLCDAAGVVWLSWCCVAMSECYVML
jgi:hypothetical protein